jgi:hypothetical protein
MILLLEEALPCDQEVRSIQLFLLIQHDLSLNPLVGFFREDSVKTIMIFQVRSRRCILTHLLNLFNLLPQQQGEGLHKLLSVFSKEVKAKTTLIYKTLWAWQPPLKGLLAHIGSGANLLFPLTTLPSILFSSSPLVCFVKDQSSFGGKELAPCF